MLPQAETAATQAKAFVRAAPAMVQDMAEGIAKDKLAEA